MEKSITTLREEFAALHAETSKASATLDTATAEELTANKAKFDRMDAIKLALDADKRLAEYAFTANKVVKAVEPQGFEVADSATIKVIDREEFSRATWNWLRDGVMSNKYATITTATQSGILLPKSVLAPLVPTAANAFRQGYDAWGLTPYQSQGDTSQFNVPVADPAAGGLVAENASSETENAPTLSESILSICKTYQSGSVYYSNMQLAAVSFDLLSNTVPVLAANKELGLESAMTAAIIADSGITQSVATSTISGVTYANFAKLNNKLPKRYQSFKVNIFSADLISATEGLVDSQGRPIFTVDAQNQNLRRVLNVPTFRSDYFAAFGANNVVGVQLSLIGFHMRDAGEGLIRYTQVPAKPNQTGVNLFGYHAYGYAVSSIVKLTCPAS